MSGLFFFYMISVFLAGSGKMSKHVGKKKSKKKKILNETINCNHIIKLRSTNTHFSPCIKSKCGANIVSVSIRWVLHGAQVVVQS